jgi:hypothetical protein
MDNSNRPTLSAQHRRVWEPPTLKQVGKVGEVLQSGSGKATVSAADGGDTLKPKGMG